MALIKPSELALDGEGHELMPHGTDDFPCLGYDEEHDDTPAGELPWHWHNDFEANLVIEGNLRMRVPGTSVLLGAGDACFVNASVPHEAAGAPHARLYGLVFSPLLICGTYDSVFARRYVMPLVRRSDLPVALLSHDDPGDASALGLMSQAVEALDAEVPGYEVAVREALSWLVCDILARVAAPSARREAIDVGSTRVRVMCDFVEEHYAERIGVGDIARAGGVGERECLRAFRASLATSPSVYLRQCRMRRAADLLVHEPGMSVAEVAHEVGVSGSSSLAQLFRKDYRCSPHEYRTRARGLA